MGSIRRLLIGDYKCCNFNQELCRKEKVMNKIASFTVNHLDLLTGVYVSRKDYIGDVCLTTFDLRCSIE